MFSFGKVQKKMRVLSILAFVAILVAAIAGCGDGDSSTSESTAESGQDGQSTSAGDSAQGRPEEGKKIGYLDIAAAAASQIRLANTFEYGAKQLGWTVDAADAAGDPTKALTAFEGLVLEEPDAIVASSIPAEFIRPAVQMAKEKEIPLVNIVTKATPGVYDADIDESQNGYAEALSAEIESTFPNGAEVGYIADCENEAEMNRQKLIEEEFEGSKVKVVGRACTEIVDPSGAQKKTIDLINANPGISVIISGSDQHPQYVLAGLNTSGNEDVKFYTGFANSSTVPLMNQKNFPAVVDGDAPKIALLALDELVNYFAGDELVEQQDVEISPVIVSASELKGEFRESLENNESVIPLPELAEPFLEKWNLVE